MFVVFTSQAVLSSDSFQLKDSIDNEDACIGPSTERLNTSVLPMSDTFMNGMLQLLNGANTEPLSTEPELCEDLPEDNPGFDSPDDDALFPVHSGLSVQITAALPRLNVVTQRSLASIVCAQAALAADAQGAPIVLPSSMAHMNR